MDNLNVLVGKEIRAIMAANNTSVTFLSNATEISLSTLHRYLNGTRDITVVALSEIVGQFGMREADFFERLDKRIQAEIDAMSPNVAAMEDEHAKHLPPPPGFNLEAGRVYIWGPEASTITPADELEGPIDLHDRGVMAVRLCECGGVTMISQGVIMGG